MHQSPDVSVIIPAYNRAEFLPESIDSILAQRWSGSLEILCVDDGSDTDPFARLPPSLPQSVRLLRKAHEGVGAARKHALENAEGRFIAFNDDDDLWLPDSLASRLALLEQNPELDLVFTDLREFTTLGDAPKSRNKDRKDFVRGARERINHGEPPLYRYDRNSLIADFMIGAPMFFQTVLARRTFVDRIGGMDARTKSCGDCLDFALRATHGGVIGYFDTPTFRLRRGHAHMTATDDWLEREMREFFEVFISYPLELQTLLRPWLARYLSHKGWLHYEKSEYREALAAYRHAASHGRIGLGARARWILSAIRSFA